MALYLNGKKLSGEPHNYSTDEQVVGTWIDGSTIYEKTFDLGSEINIPYISWYNTGLTGFNKICGCFGMNNSGANYPLNASIQSDTLHLWGCRGTEVSVVRYLTLRYTKSST